jgi:hypothetical protein
MMEHSIRYFGLNNIALETDLRKVAREKKIRLRPSRIKAPRDAFYPQITEQIRRDGRASRAVSPQPGTPPPGTRP